MDLLIRGGYVITIDDDRRVYRNGYVAIDGGRIADVGQDADCTLTADRTIDARGKVVLPGLVNAHNHLNQIAFRGRQDDGPRGGGMVGFIKDQIDLWKGAGAETTYRLIRLHLMDMVRGGTTATHDQHFTNIPADNIEGCLRALDESGMRGLVSRCQLSEPSTTPPDSHETVDVVLKETERLRAAWNSDRIQVTASPINPSYVATCEELVALREGLRAMGAPFDIDLAGDLWRETMARFDFNGSPVAFCAELGILDDQTLGGKSFNLQQSDYAIWARLGVKACLVPFGRLYRELGVPLHHFLAQGVVPGIGTDAPMSHPTTSLWETMRLTLTSLATRKMAEARAGIPDDADVTAGTETVLEMATVAGARALFLDPSVGGLAAGNAADLVILDARRAALAPTLDDRRLLTSLVWCAESAMVDIVIVNGKMLLEGGVSTVWDEERVIAEAEVAARDLFAKADMESVLPRRGAGETQGGWRYL